MSSPLSPPIHAIIFDFDGTIADSFDIFIEIFQDISGRELALSAQDIQELRKLHMKEALKKMGIPAWRIPRLLIRGRHEICSRIEHIQPFPGMSGTLARLASARSLYIVSTNSEENIVRFLTQNHLSAYIRGIYGNIGLTGKARSLKKLCAKEHLKISECIYIGDETRDIEAAKKAGMRCVAVQWGYGHPETLAAHIPDGLADRPEALPGILG